MVKVKELTTIFIVLAVLAVSLCAKQFKLYNAITGEDVVVYEGEPNDFAKIRERQIKYRQDPFDPNNWSLDEGFEPVKKLLVRPTDKWLERFGDGDDSYLFYNCLQMLRVINAQGRRISVLEKKS